MSYMTRRNVALVALVVITFTVGCTTIQDGTTEPTQTNLYDDTGDGELIAVPVSDAPPNGTVVNYSDERIRNEYLRKAVRRAANRSQKVVVAVPERDVNETKQDLDELPLYSINESSSSDYDWGYYVRYERTVVRVQFAVLE